VKREKTGFTLVELLTVLAIIALLVSMLIPSLTLIRNTAKEAKQKAQLTEIGLALTAFRNDYGDYPPSYWMLPPGLPGAPGPMDYCGAQKLAEALLGRDLMGFHPKSDWTATNPTFYPLPPPPQNLEERRGPYLELATTNAFKLGDLYGPALAASSLSAVPDTFVICDSFGVKKITIAPGQTAKAGTPILYYRAETTSKTIEPPAAPFQRIYNIFDNVPFKTLALQTWFLHIDFSRGGWPVRNKRRYL
jgi:prepilin-type N-terminal cleavage/methylation domain-containing protein